MRGSSLFVLHRHLVTIVSCRIPDHHIVPSRSPLLLVQEVFQALAGDGIVADREAPAC